MNIKRKSSTIPFGYKESEIEGWFAPIKTELEILFKYLTQLKNKRISLREASTLIEQESNRKISHVSLKSYLDKNMWDIFPDRFEQNEDGSFILGTSGKPRKKGGRPKGSKSGYTYSAEERRKRDVKIKNLNLTERQTKKLKSFIRNNFKENEKYDNTIKFIGAPNLNNFTASLTLFENLGTK